MLACARTFHTIILTRKRHNISIRERRYCRARITLTGLFIQLCIIATINRNDHLSSYEVPFTNKYYELCFITRGEMHNLSCYRNDLRNLSLCLVLLRYECSC